MNRFVLFSSFVVVALVVGLHARPAHATIDCYGIERICKAGTECGWDADMHMHRCMPTAAALKKPSAPTKTPAAPTEKPAGAPSAPAKVSAAVVAQPATFPLATVSSSDHCKEPWSMDRCLDVVDPRTPADPEHRVCKRKVLEHNTRCAAKKACADAGQRAERICDEAAAMDHAPAKGIACVHALHDAIRACPPTKKP